jgi:hypothetical protein
MKNYGTLENVDMELSISRKMGEEEARRVRHALSEADRRARTRAARREQIVTERQQIERQRCIAICERFPDNLMARHIAYLIRSGQ